MDLEQNQLYMPYYPDGYGSNVDWNVSVPPLDVVDSLLDYGHDDDGHNERSYVHAEKVASWDDDDDDDLQQRGQHPPYSTKDGWSCRVSPPNLFFSRVAVKEETNVRLFWT
jgi:hypothetical protein